MAVERVDGVDAVDVVDPSSNDAIGDNTRVAVGLRQNCGPKLAGVFAGRVFMTVLK